MFSIELFINDIKFISSNSVSSGLNSILNLIGQKGGKKGAPIMHSPGIHGKKGERRGASVARSVTLQ